MVNFLTGSGPSFRDSTDKLYNHYKLFDAWTGDQDTRPVSGVTSAMGTCMWGPTQVGRGVLHPSGASIAAVNATVSVSYAISASLTISSLTILGCCWSGVAFFYLTMEKDNGWD